MQKKELTKKVLPAKVICNEKQWFNNIDGFCHHIIVLGPNIVIFMDATLARWDIID